MVHSASSADKRTPKERTVNRDSVDRPVTSLLYPVDLGTVIVDPTFTIRYVLTRFRAGKIGPLLVCDSFDRFIGMVTEHDILQALAEIGDSALDKYCAQLMQPASRTFTVTPRTTIAEAMSGMIASEASYAPVMEAGLPIGLISFHDVVRAVELTSRSAVRTDETTGSVRHDAAIDQEDAVREQAAAEILAETDQDLASATQNGDVIDELLARITAVRGETIV